MRSGREVAERNWRDYLAWKVGKSAEDFRKYLSNVRGRMQLSRRMIAQDCGIGESAPRQNPRIAQDLEALEEELRKVGVLPAAASHPEPPREISKKSPYEHGLTRQERRRLQNLENENATLREENRALKDALKRYDLLERFLSETMRVPR
jgi:hypothetical protein